MEHGAGASMTVARKRVLVVDDDRELVESVRVALVTRGYDVVVAWDGTQALARVEQYRPDLMLLDMVMPRRSGFTVLDRMRRQGMPATPIIMMTGNDEQRHQDAAAQRGVLVFLHKPFAIEQLVSEVDTILGV
jgi:DNA-binding response OmpR family regulator